MIDITDVAVEKYDVEGINVQAVLPASDTRKVCIPSPPSISYVPINPRPAYIFVTETAVSDEMKAYAKENKVVFLIPEKGDAEDMAGVYAWAVSKASKLNIIKDQISVKGDSASMELAKEVAEIIQEDEDIDDAEEFSI